MGHRQRRTRHVEEETDRLREREDQLRLQRLEREVEELRARELARGHAQPEVIYTDVYVPAYGYGRPLHRRDTDDVKLAPGTADRQTQTASANAAYGGSRAPRSPTGALTALLSIASGRAAHLARTP